MINELCSKRFSQQSFKHCLNLDNTWQLLKKVKIVKKKEWNEIKNYQKMSIKKQNQKSTLKIQKQKDQRQNCLYLVVFFFFFLGEVEEVSSELLWSFLISDHIKIKGNEQHVNWKSYQRKGCFSHILAYFLLISVNLQDLVQHQRRSFDNQ